MASGWTPFGSKAVCGGPISSENWDRGLAVDNYYAFIFFNFLIFFILIFILHLYIVVDWLDSPQLEGAAAGSNGRPGKPLDG